MPSLYSSIIFLCTETWPVNIFCVNKQPTLFLLFDHQPKPEFSHLLLPTYLTLTSSALLANLILIYAFLGMHSSENVLTFYSLYILLYAPQGLSKIKANLFKPVHLIVLVLWFICILLHPLKLHRPTFPLRTSPQQQPFSYAFSFLSSEWPFYPVTDW